VRRVIRNSFGFGANNEDKFIIFEAINDAVEHGYPEDNYTTRLGNITHWTFISDDFFCKEMEKVRQAQDKDFVRFVKNTFSQVVDNLFKEV